MTIKDNITYCDWDKKIVHNVEWTIIRTKIEGETGMVYITLDFCDYNCMKNWVVSFGKPLGYMDRLRLK